MVIGVRPVARVRIKTDSIHQLSVGSSISTRTSSGASGASASAGSRSSSDPVQLEEAVKIETETSHGHGNAAGGVGQDVEAGFAENIGDGLADENSLPVNVFGLKRHRVGQDLVLSPRARGLRGARLGFRLLDACVSWKTKRQTGARHGVCGKIK